MVSTQLDSLKRALGDLRVPLYVCDTDARFRWLNAAMVELVGDLVGRSGWIIVPPEWMSLADRELNRKLHAGATSTEFDLAVFDRDGRRVPVRIRSVALREGSTVVGVLGAAIPVPAPERPAPKAPPSRRPALTARQHETLRLLGEGYGTMQIARRLGVSEDTARNHIRAVLRELQAHTRLQAVVTAYKTGLLEPTL
jgi:PAS domain S-box-containing protein